MNVVNFISEERLKPYEALTDRQEKAVVLHNHTLQLGSSLMSMIALFELALRNSTNQHIIDDFGEKNWLLPQGAGAVPLKSQEKAASKRAVDHARKAAYSKLSNREKGLLDAFAYPKGIPAGISHRDKVKMRQALFVVSHGQIISQTTFVFWKRLYSNDYEETLWKPSLKRVFPNKSLRRADISTSMETVYATRNRVAHHEPVYGARLEEAMQALAFLRDSLGARSSDSETSFKRFSRIQYLRLRMDYESFLEAWKTLT